MHGWAIVENGVPLQAVSVPRRSRAARRFYCRSPTAAFATRISIFRTGTTIWAAANVFHSRIGAYRCPSFRVMKRSVRSSRSARTPATSRWAIIE